MDRRKAIAQALVPPQAEMRSHEPSWRDKIAWALAGRVSDDKHRQQNIAGKVGTVLDFIPGIGEVVGMNEAYRDAQAGNYGQAALGVGMTALGSIPGGDIPAKAAKRTLDGIAAAKAAHMAEAERLKAQIEALGPQFEARIEPDRGGSVYLKVLQHQLTKSGERAKNRTPQSTRFKARLSDHGSYYGSTVSVDPISGNTADDALAVFRHAVLGEGEPPVLARSSIDPSTGEQLRKRAQFERKSFLAGVDPWRDVP